MRKTKAKRLEPDIGHLQILFAKAFEGKEFPFEYFELMSIEDALVDAQEDVTAAHSSALQTEERYADLTEFPLADAAELFLNFKPENGTSKIVEDTICGKFIFEFYARNKGCFLLSAEAHTDTVYLWTMT